MATKEQEVLQIASDLYKQNPDWVTFFREVLGLEGIVRSAFRDKADLDVFEATEEYQKINMMLVQLRRRRGGAGGEPEPTTVITVRLPKSLHEALKQEAELRVLSMNKLCIAKLLQVLDGVDAPSTAEPDSEVELVPSEGSV